MRRVLLSVAFAAAAAPLAAQSFDIQKVADGVWAAIPKPGVPVGSRGATAGRSDHRPHRPRPGLAA